MALLEDGKVFNIKCGIKDYTDEYGTNHTLEEYFNWFRQQFINALNISADDFWMDWGNNNSPFFQLPYINESDYYIPLLLDSSINKTNLLSSLSTNNNIFMEIGLGLYQNNKISNNYIYKDNDDNIYYSTDTNINSNLNINNYTMFIINTNFLEDNGFYTIGVISTDKKIKEGYTSPSILVCDIINKFNNKRCDGVIFLNLSGGSEKNPYNFNTTQLRENNLGKLSISAYIPDFDENDEEQGEYELKGFFPQMFTPDESSFSAVKIHFGKLRPIRDIYLTKVTNTALSSFCYYQNMLEEKNSWKNFINTDIFNNKKTFSLGLNSSIINDIDVDNTENWIPAVEIKKKESAYLEFSSDIEYRDFTLYARKSWDGILEYSIDNGKNWNEWNGSELICNSKQSIYLRGTGNSKITGLSGSNWTFTGEYIKGNIETLLDYQIVQKGEHPEMSEGCYYTMFKDCKSLTEAPELPAITLSQSCYNSMFNGCISLKRAPELPATNLTVRCYYNMFHYCISLAEAPKLPATNLKDYCYYSMFNSCKSLIEAPELPATNLREYCYRAMFYNCESLTEAPELPATNLAVGCYYQMFHYCISLAEAPELPATTLFYGCYYSMFNSCKSLIEAPKLSATILADRCYQEMFNNCTLLKQAPKLPATTLGIACYRDMFNNCISLAEAPKLPATNLKDYCYYSMFNSCKSLIEAPELPATNLADSCYGDMFYYCESLKQAPELPATTLFYGCYYEMFGGCKSLKQAPKLPATILASDCYNSMFYNCNSLIEAPKLSAVNLKSYCYFEMFDGCASLKQAPELPATTLSFGCYQKMFNNCTSLIQTPELLATVLANYCYDSMFAGCKSLINIPKLPAINLKSYCYAYMFENCSKIKLSKTQSSEYPYSYKIPISGDGSSVSYTLSGMFNGTGGTFTGTPTINTTYYTSNEVV